MPNKFAILPAEVRYHTALTSGEKLLYAEITACADENGVCNATNEHFSGAFGKSTKWVSNSLTSLKKYGCIDVEISKSKGNYREIRLLPTERINTAEIPLTIETVQSDFAGILAAYPNKAVCERAEAVFAELSPDSETVALILADIEKRRNSTAWAAENAPLLCNYLAKRKWIEQGSIGGSKQPQEDGGLPSA